MKKMFVGSGFSNKNIISIQFDDGGGVLVDLDAKSYYQLNQTAMLVWLGLEKGKTLAEIVSGITSVYDVIEEHAKKSVERILQDLQSKNLFGAKSA